MRLVLDANIALAAVIRRKLTYALINDERLELYAPDYLLDELMGKLEVMREKSGMDDYSLLLIIRSILAKLNLVADSEFTGYYANASAICPDEEDAVYFALAMKLRCPVWSNDGILKNQDTVAVLDTDDVLKNLFGDESAS